MRRRFLAYGARASPSIAVRHGKRDDDIGSSAQGGSRVKGILNKLLDRIVSIRVPHSWFTSFYIVSILSSVFWATQIVSKGSAFNAIAQLTQPTGSSMTVSQVMVAWAMLFIQGNRRLYECLDLSKPSNARMWVGHWLLGILFYVGMSIAIWIEGVGMSRLAFHHICIAEHQTATLRAHSFSFEDLVFAPPSLRTIVSVLPFILASGIQHDCHAYLASLKSPSKDYQLPIHPVFQRLVCPHYFAECIIYLALSIAAAPSGRIINWTVFSGLIFVGVNLGVTAGMTKQWYAQKFGKESVEHRWKMLPLLY